MPFMITRQMRADLSARGFSDAQIRKMTPAQAHAHLAGAAERPLERCAHCGGELARGDMLPLNSGGHVHQRCADDFISARDAASTGRPRAAARALQAYRRGAGQACSRGDPPALRGRRAGRSHAATRARAARRFRCAAHITEIADASRLQEVVKSAASVG